MRNKLAGRLLCTVLTATMLVGSIDATVFAMENLNESVLVDQSKDEIEETDELTAETNIDSEDDGINESIIWNEEDIQAAYSLTYKVNADGTATITGYRGSGIGSLYIPSTIDGYTVTVIGESAFENGGDFTGSLTIPNTVKVIGDDAFSGCRGLDGSLTIPNSVTTIGDRAFWLTGFSGTLTIPSSVETIGIAAFYDDFYFTSLIISNGVKTIGDGAFEYCSGFTGSLTIPNSVTSIGKYAFHDCSGFTGSLTISNSVTTIGDWAFQDCSGFTGSLTIPNSVTTIGDRAFEDCSGFNGSLTLSNSVETMGICAFSKCVGFKSITIPDGVKVIGDYAFSGCSGFGGSLTIPNSVTSIGDYAFNGCDGFTSAAIPSNVTSIGRYVFSAPRDKFYIIGESGSCAEEYALRYGYRFRGGKCTVTFNSNGGSISYGLSSNLSSVSIETNSDGIITDYPTATISGKIFGGWYTDPIEGEKADVDYIYFGDTSLYAHFYEKNEIRYKDDMASWINNAFSYNLSEDDLALMKKNLSNSSYKSVMKHYSKSYEGKTGPMCYGMSAAMIANKMGHLDLSKYGINCFNELSSKDYYVQRLITMYQLMQYTNVYKESTLYFIQLSGKEQMRRVVRAAQRVDTDGPALCDFSFGTFNTDGHSIIIDGIEEGNYEVNGNQYYYRIKTYDPNSNEGIPANGFRLPSGILVTTKTPSEKGYIYVSENFDYWTIEYEEYMDGKKRTSGIRNVVTEDWLISAFNYKEQMTDLEYYLLQLQTPYDIYDSAISIGGAIVDFINNEPDSGVVVFRDIKAESESAMDYCEVVLRPGNDIVRVESTNSQNRTIDVARGCNDEYVSISTDDAEAVEFDGENSTTKIVGNKSDYVVELVNKVVGELSLEGKTDGTVSVENNDDSMILESTGDMTFSLTLGDEVIASDIAADDVKICKVDDLVTVLADSNNDGEYDEVIAQQDRIFAYKVNEDGISATITGYEGEQNGDLVIPESIDGYKVTAIGDSAFEGCTFFKNNLIISDGVTSIGNSAFKGCYGFTGDLTIPGSVTTIGESAFEECYGFTGNLVINEGVKTIGDNAFNCCYDLTGDLTIPSSVTTIGNSAFASCFSFNGNLTIPSSVTSIGGAAFSCCSNLTGNLIIPSGLTSIDGYVFHGCASLTGGLTIPKSVTSIGDGAFYGCSGFTGDLTIPDNVTQIGREAFRDCTGFEGNLTIPNSITTISDKAFQDCTGLSGSLIIPNSVTTVCFYAFSNCRSFTGDLIIPDSVCEIESRAFEACTGFTGNLILSNNLTVIGDYAFNGCSGFTGSLRIPDNVETIGNYAFYNCSGFTGDLTIPESVTTLRVAFKYCSGIRRVDNKSASIVNLKDLSSKKKWYNVDTMEEIESICQGVAAREDYSSVQDYFLRFRVDAIEDQVYTGSDIKPKVNVYFGKQLLSEDVDYTLSYKNNKNVYIGPEDGSKSPYVIVKGKGNFSNTDIVYFNIRQKNISDDDVVVSIADKAYTGSTKESKPTVKYGKLTLKEKTDYDLSFDGDLIYPGTVKVTIKAKGNYTGTAVITYKIYLKDFSKLYVEPVANQEYTGSEITPEIVLKNAKTDSIDISPDNYEVKYENNTNVGTATAIITGKGAYADYGNSKKVTFKIVQKDIKNAVISVLEDSTYTGAALKPSIVVTDSDTGEDIPADCYTVAYSNNTNVPLPYTAVGKLPTVKITGKKNYKGSAAVLFDITPEELIVGWDEEVDGLSIVVPDVKESTKAVTVSDIKPVIKYGKKTLTKGKDYTFVFERDPGSMMQEITIFFVGNYSGSINKSFMIYPAAIDAATLDVKLDKDTFTYTGQKIIPPVTVKTTIDGNTVTLIEGRDYKVVCANNTNAAEATAKTAPNVKITGMGAYKGSSNAIKFTIDKKKLIKGAIIVTVDDAKYTKSAVKPKLTVIDKATGKTFAAANYTVAYSNNIAISEKSENGPKVLISGKGNYQTLLPLEYDFRIYEKSISSLVFDKIANVEYTGKQITPKGDGVKIYTDRNKTKKLTEGQDYKLSYDTNTKAGTGKVIVTGMGAYGGTKVLTFTIVPKWLKWLLL